MKFAQLCSLFRAVHFASGRFAPSETGYNLDRVSLRSVPGSTEAYATDGKCIAFWSIASEIDGFEHGRQMLLEAGGSTILGERRWYTSHVRLEPQGDDPSTWRFILDPRNSRDNQSQICFVDHYVSDTPRYPRLLEHILPVTPYWDPANASNHRLQSDKETLEEFLRSFLDPARTFYHVCGNKRTVSRSAMLPRSVRVHGDVCFDLNTEPLLDWLEILPVDAQVTGHFSTESPESVWHSSYGHRLLLFPVVRRRSSWTDSDPTEPVCVFSKMCSGWG